MLRCYNTADCVAVLHDCGLYCGVTRLEEISAQLGLTDGVILPFPAESFRLIEVRLQPEECQLHVKKNCFAVLHDCGLCCGVT